MSDNILTQLKQSTSEEQKIWIITNALLKTLPNDVAEAAIAASVPHWFDAAVLTALVQVESAEAERLYQDLQKLTFTEPFGDLGFALHDLTRSGILSYLTVNQVDIFQTYSQRAFEYFRQFDDPQNVVEATYHILVTDKATGMEKFKEQMKNYRREANFGAANNLIRNAQELVELGLLPDKVATEIDHQNYLIGWEFLRRGRMEKASEKTGKFFDQAIKFFNPAEDIGRYKQLGPTQLHDTVSTLQRNFLTRKLNEAKRLGDTNRQKIWIAEIADIYLENKDYEVALQRYNDALSLDENDKKAIVGIGQVHLALEHYQDALKHFNRAIELDPDDDWSNYERGLGCLSANFPDQAQSDFSEAISLASQKYEENPENWRNTFNLSLYHLASGETQKADRLYRKALAVSVPVHNIREAISDLDDFLRLFPEHQQAQAIRRLLQEYLNKRYKEVLP